MCWNHQTVLITGADGFIGSHLTERLVELGAQTRALILYNSFGSRGWLETSLLKSDIEFFTGDIRDRESLRQAFDGVDTVFHLAALIAIPYSYAAPLSYVRTNVEGTLNVLQSALHAGVQRVVHTSTSEVYGSARYVPIDEAHPLQGQSPYSASKIGADKIAEAFHLSFGLPVATLRPFNTFGPRQSARAVIPAIIVQALTQSSIRLGNMDTTRDFNFVSDTVEGFVRAAEVQESVGEVINIGSGQEVSIGELARVVRELLNVETPVEMDTQRIRPSTSEVERLCADNRKALNILGWQPRQNLRDGLVQTIKWMEKNVEKYRPAEYTV